MEQVNIIGIDLAKRSFQLHGARADGSVAFRRKVSREKFLYFLAVLPRCVVAMEACASAHHWGREILQLGHDVRLVPPIYVKPFVKRQKNDAADAEAICEAAQRPTMRFVAVKGVHERGRIREVTESLVPLASPVGLTDVRQGLRSSRHSALGVAGESKSGRCLRPGLSAAISGRCAPCNFRFYPYRLQSLALLARCACQEGRQVPRVDCRRRARHHRRRGLCLGQTITPPTGWPIVSHVLTRSTPAGSSAALRPGLGRYGAGAPRPGKTRDRGSVAALPAPAPLAHSAGPTSGPGDLRCERGKKWTSHRGSTPDRRRPVVLLQLQIGRSS